MIDIPDQRDGFVKMKKEKFVKRRKSGLPIKVETVLERIVDTSMVFKDGLKSKWKLTN